MFGRGGCNNLTSLFPPTIIGVRCWRNWKTINIQRKTYTVSNLAPPSNSEPNRWTAHSKQVSSEMLERSCSFTKRQWWSVTNWLRSLKNGISRWPSKTIEVCPKKGNFWVAKRLIPIKHSTMWTQWCLINRFKLKEPKPLNLYFNRYFSNHCLKFSHLQKY